MFVGSPLSPAASALIVGLPVTGLLAVRSLDEEALLTRELTATSTGGGCATASSRCVVTRYCRTSDRSIIRRPRGRKHHQALESCWLKRR